MTPEEELLNEMGRPAIVNEIDRGPLTQLGQWKLEDPAVDGSNPNAGKSLQELHPELTPQPVITRVQEQAPRPEPAPYDGGVARQPGGGGFDFERYAAGLYGPQGIAALDNSRLAARRQAQGEIDSGLDREMKRGELADKQADRALKNKELRDSLDANSELSRATAESFRTQALGLAQMLGDGPGARLLAQLAGQSNGANALQVRRLADQVERLTKTQMDLSNANYKREKDLDEKKWKETVHNDAMANVKAAQGLTAASLAETRRQNNLKAQERSEIRAEKEAEAYGKDVAPLNEAEAELEEAKRLKGDPDKPKANTGVFAEGIHRVRKFFGLPSLDMLNLEAAQGTINSVVRKLNAGTSLSKGEKDALRQYLPELDMDDDEFSTKLDRMLKTVRGRKEQIDKKHPQTSGGKDAKAEKARRALDPNSGATPEQRAGAEAYLRSIGAM